MTLELIYGQAYTMISIPDGFTCPLCESVHFLAFNVFGRTYCPTCQPEKEDQP